MAETLDCPKCGALVKFSSIEQAAAGTVTCGYCGDTILIPEKLRLIPAEPPAGSIGAEYEGPAADRFHLSDRAMLDTDDDSILHAADIEYTGTPRSPRLALLIVPLLVIFLIVACLVARYLSH
jgi:hypothetical protein